MELKLLIARNFVKPMDCKTVVETGLWVKELCAQIEIYRKQFNYVPDFAYVLLASYTARQNSLLYKDFIETYR